MDPYNSNPKRYSDRILIYILVAILLAILCMVCLGSGILIRRYAFPDVKSTRTALAELFGTITPLVTPSLQLDTPQASPTKSPQPLPTQTQIPPKPTYSPPVWLEPPPGKIVYACFVNGYDQICKMKADGSGIIQLTDEESTNFYPSFDPDGERIVFSSRRDGDFEIYIMDVDGSNVHKLTDNIGNLYAPEISPNGKRIVFTAESGGKQAIWIMKIDGGNARPISSDDIYGIDPTWSPSGDRIAFAYIIGGSTQLFIVNADGTKLKQVTKGISGIGGRSTWSPDGEWLAFYAGPKGDRAGLWLFNQNPKGKG